MSLSRRDVFLASFAGFVAWGFVVRWVPVLRFLGYAFVAGIVVTLLALLAITVSTTKRKGDAGSTTAIDRASVKFLSSSEWPFETSHFLSARIYQPDQSVAMFMYIAALAQLVLDY